jgi:hypothetical protein
MGVVAESKPLDEVLSIWASQIFGHTDREDRETLIKMSTAVSSELSNVFDSMYLVLGPMQ